MNYFDVSLPWPARVANRLGHWGAQILMASIMAAIVLGVRPLSPENPLSLEAPLLLFVVVLGSWGLMRKHDRRLCESCMSTLPLNASQTAARYGRRFAIAHLASNMRFTVAYLVVLIGSSPVLLDTNLVPHPLAQYLWAAIQLTMVYLVLSYTTHRKLQPWCPQCSGGGGGRDKVEAPEPVPTGSHSA